MRVFSSDQLQNAVACIAAEIDTRFQTLSVIRGDELGLWNEFSCCLLSSQVPYEMAKAASQRITDAGLFRTRHPLELHDLRAGLSELLSAPLPMTTGLRRYRFPNARAHQLATAFGIVCKEFGSLSQMLDHCQDARAARAWMVKHIPGVGPKQASMFLRNAGMSYDLAIIDRHVLRYMHVTKLCRSSSGVAAINNYERHELQLRLYAQSLGFAVGRLDWAIWIVMRAASKIE